MAYKIDPEILKDSYGRMNDKEILDFAKKEGLDLTSEAFLLLREELKKRNIGADIIHGLENEIILRYGLQVKKFEDDFHDDLNKKAWEYALNSKAAGVPNSEIHAGLQELGVGSEYSFHIISKLKEQTVVLTEDSKNEALSGIVITIIGAILVYISFQIEHFIAPAILFLLVGIVRIFVSLYRKEKLRKLKSNIEAESDDDDF